MTLAMTREAPLPFEGPQPLLRKIAPGDPYPVAALGPLRPAIEAVQGMTLAPIAIPAGSALAVASLAVMGHADVETLGGRRPVSLYVLTIAASGERKTSSDRPLISGLVAHEAERAEIHASDYRVWQNAFALHDAERKSILRNAGSGKKEKRASAQADLAALGDAPRAPRLPDRTASEPTLEGLFRAFAEGHPAQGLFSDEAAQFLGGHALNADNRMKTLSGLNALWDGSPIRRTRAGDGIHTLRGRRLALHLMVQPVAANAFLADDLAGGLGFLARCLIAEPPSTIGSRFSSLVRSEGETELALTSHRLKAVLDAELPLAPDGQTLQPRLLALGTHARTLVVQFADEVERLQAKGGQLAHVSAAASKAAEQACRIAAVLTLWANLDAAEVSAEAMANGIELAQFYLGEASRLASAATVSAEIAKADTLRIWLCDRWSEPEVMVRDVVQMGPSALRESPKARAALELLEKHGWLVRLTAGTAVRGKGRKLAWRIVRGNHDVL